MNGRTTIEDVAKAAGVSRQTVSRVLNNKADVSPETRQRILHIIEQMGYRPSRIARGLATARTATFGLVLPDVANPYFAEIVRGAEDVARERDTSVFLCNTDEDPQRELAALRSLDAQHVDGILLCSPRLSDEELGGLIPRLPPVVLINHRLVGMLGERISDQGPAGDPQESPTGIANQRMAEEHRDRGVDDLVGVGGSPLVSAVLVDDAAGTQAAVQHLWDGGHRRIGLLAGPTVSHSSQRRMAGYKTQLAHLGSPIQSDYIRYCQATASGGQIAAWTLLEGRPELTALVAYNDLVAAGALKACRELGRQVPEDVAIVGCDDIYMASLVTPELTTLRVSGRSLGQEATRLLLRQLETAGSTQPREVWLQPRLIIRGSAP